MILHTFGQWSSLASMKKEMMQHREEINIKVTSGRTEAKIKTFLRNLQVEFCKERTFKRCISEGNRNKFCRGSKYRSHKSSVGMLSIPRNKAIQFLGRACWHQNQKEATITTIKSLLLLSHTFLSFYCQHKSTQRLSPLSQANTHHSNPLLFFPFF